MGGNTGTDGAVRLRMGFYGRFVLYPSVSRIPEESEQFHIVEDAYTKKIQEIMGRVEAAYQASLNESKELSRIAQDLEEAENLIKTIIRRDGSDENFEWFGKIYMQKTLIQGKLQRQSSMEIKRNLSGNRKNLVMRSRINFSEYTGKQRKEAETLSLQSDICMNKAKERKLIIMRRRNTIRWRRRKDMREHSIIWRFCIIQVGV